MKLTDKQLYDLRMKVRHIAEHDLDALSSETERTNVWPEKLWDICREHGLLRFRLPEQYGGMGLSCEQFFPIMEEMSRGNGGIRMMLHHVNGLGWHILHDHGAEDLKNKLLPKIGTGEYYINFALTEPGCGSGADIRTKAEKKGDKYVLNGRKTLISFTDVANASYVLTVTDESKRKKGGLSAFLVETNRPGFRIEPMPHMMGCKGAGHGDIVMENCEVPAHNIVGKEGDGLDIFKNALALSRASIAVCLLGMSQRFLELAIKRAKDRVTFGKALVQRQAIQQTIADMGTQVYALRSMLMDLARDFDQGKDIELKSAMCKLHGIDTSRTVSDACIEIFGGIGYFEDNPYGPVERLYRDARAMWFEEGPRTVQRLTAARPLIDNGGNIE
ncbi:acyl-CoA dehydrogenase family protein [Telmatospirillum sp.]|uniref:acyl-CoA dehydrogenase family protein n=1 Tax=Telmatospirillum sp. TaxID=2079197 RepID=UPI00284311E3|nr:acyl-CoA dehydrogenase family protein [Telmatospirillum sp.]MDR3439326.1 acyl-CoA/acyl-ACP dehydrogenase [Telmatospirillum sp.]